MTSPLRDAAESATAGVPVVRGLVWRDLRPNAFPDMWCATSACGVYDIEEHSASDSPVYVALGPHYAFIANKDSLDEAKLAAQADYEQRIRYALNPDFLSALDTARAEIERLRVEYERADHAASCLADMVNELQPALTAAQARIAELEERLGTLHSFVSVMIGSGPECVIPEEIASPLGIPLRIGNLMREIDATLSPAVKEPK